MLRSSAWVWLRACSREGTMRRVLQGLSWVAILFLALFVIVTGIGMTLPKDHVASRALMLEKHSPSLVYGLITDFAAGPRWRPGLVKVEKVQSRMGLDV